MESSWRVTLGGNKIGIKIMKGAGFLLLLFKILFIFRERGREGEREGEKH